MWRKIMLLLAISAVVWGCSHAPPEPKINFSPVEKTAAQKSEEPGEASPLDWGIILYGVRAFEEEPGLSISKEQAGKLLGLVNKLMEVSRSSNGLKRAINGALSQEQEDYLLKLAAEDRLDRDELADELQKFPPETALIDLVDSRLKPISEKIGTAPPEPENFPQRKKEVNVLSDLLVGILKIKDLSPDQAYLIRKYIERIRPLLAEEFRTTSEMETILTPEQQKFIYKNVEKFTLMTDELPVEPVKGDNPWLAQAETPFLKSMKDFLESKAGL
ncbi:MAG: hypothetical protein M1269_01195 [Chloroflexi bacterium]|nr:hypothetical protein [Chloroflexota bacterium]